MNTDNISKGLNTLFDNKTFSTSMSLLLALYAGAAAPALPNNVIVFFDTVFGKLLITFLIAYLSSKNIQLALMLAVAFVVSLNIINTNKINEGFRTMENYGNQDCSNYEVGTSEHNDCLTNNQDTDTSETMDNADVDTDTALDLDADPVVDADGEEDDDKQDVAIGDDEDDGVGDEAVGVESGNADGFIDYEPFVPSTNMFSNTEQYYAPY